MNRKRREKKQFGRLHLVMIFIVAGLLGSGGVLHAVLKNKQVAVAREIDTAKNRIEEAEENVKIVQVKIERKLNRHIIRAELISRQSELTQIPSSAIELVTTESKAIAQAAP